MTQQITSAEAEVWIASRLPSALIALEEAKEEGFDSVLEAIRPSASDIEALRQISQTSHQTSQSNNASRLDWRERGILIQEERTLEYLQAKPRLEPQQAPKESEASNSEFCAQLSAGVRAFVAETERLKKQRL